MPTLIENAVSVTARQSATAPSTSEAATASISREEVAGLAWPQKPAATGDRFMTGNPYQRGRITRLKCNLTLIAGEIAAMRLSNHGKTAESVNKTAESVNF